MKTTFFRRALQASVLASVITSTFAQSPASSAAGASTTEALSAITTLGCYSNVDPLYKDNTNTFQTPGLCQPACANKGHAVMALIGGSTCYCGDIMPALDNKVDDSNCNSPCNGFDLQTCGGIGFWNVFLTGLSGDVSRAPNVTANSTSSGSSSHGSTSGSPIASHPAETVIVTQSATQSPSSNSDSGPNKVGIAVGVVVGVIVIAAIAGGAIVFYKQKRRREIEEEHKQQAAINSFVGSRNSDTKSDARLDPSVASSYRRESIGSIADERDFSRRILQVRNFDGRNEHV